MSPSKKPAARPAPVRTRLTTEQREQQILENAIRFFSERGLEGQTRELAQRIGITHPLLYHYFPTKRALVERVYRELFLGRWKSEWERWLADKDAPLEARLVRFAQDYASTILTQEWVRIFIFSGLSDRYIPDRYLALLRERLFPVVLRETRRHLGRPLRGKPSERETELVWSLHGSIFYIGIRRWIYGLPGPEDMGQAAEDRVRAYLAAAQALLGEPTRAAVSAPRRTRRS